MTSSKDTKIDYRAVQAELDDILMRLQGADMDVDEAVKLFERGMELTRQLEAYLKSAENTVKKIKADWEKRGA